jgi:hypothetical protein
MHSTVAVHTKGLGFSLQTAKSSSMALSQALARCRTIRDGFSGWSTRRTTARPDSANWSWSAPSGGRSADDASTKFAPADACGCHTDPSPNAAGSRREIPGPDAQESQQFLVARAFETLPDDSSLPNLSNRKQGRCRVALVVVPHRAAANFLDGQARWRAVQRLSCPVICWT